MGGCRGRGAWRISIFAVAALGHFELVFGVADAEMGDGDFLGAFLDVATLGVEALLDLGGQVEVGDLHLLHPGVQRVEDV